MSKLAFKKLLIVVIATILSLGSGAILITALNANLSKTSPQAAGSTCQISTFEQLREFSRTYSSYTGAELMNDINAMGYSITPIGTKANPLTYTFNGNGYKIMNLKIESSNSDKFFEYNRCLGLFGYCQGATIQNLILENPTVTLKQQVYDYTRGWLMTEGWNDNKNAFPGVGLICGQMYNGTISQCGVIGGQLNVSAEGFTTSAPDFPPQVCPMDYYLNEKMGLCVGGICGVLGGAYIDDKGTGYWGTGTIERCAVSKTTKINCLYADCFHLMGFADGTRYPGGISFQPYYDHNLSVGGIVGGVVGGEVATNYSGASIVALNFVMTISEEVVDSQNGNYEENLQKFWNNYSTDPSGYERNEQLVIYEVNGNKYSGATANKLAIGVDIAYRTVFAGGIIGFNSNVGFSYGDAVSNGSLKPHDNVVYYNPIYVSSWINNEQAYCKSLDLHDNYDHDYFGDYKNGDGYDTSHEVNLRSNVTGIKQNYVGIFCGYDLQRYINENKKTNLNGSVLGTYYGYGSSNYYENAGGVQCGFLPIFDYNQPGFANFINAENSNYSTDLGGYIASTAREDFTIPARCFLSLNTQSIPVPFGRDNKFNYSLINGVNLYDYISDSTKTFNGDKSSIGEPLSVNTGDPFYFLNTNYNNNVPIPRLIVHWKPYGIRVNGELTKQTVYGINEDDNNGQTYLPTNSSYVSIYSLSNGCNFYMIGAQIVFKDYSGEVTYNYTSDILDFTLSGININVVFGGFYYEDEENKEIYDNNSGQEFLLLNAASEAAETLTIPVTPRLKGAEKDSSRVVRIDVGASSDAEVTQGDPNPSSRTRSKLEIDGNTITLKDVDFAYFEMKIHSGKATDYADLMTGQFDISKAIYIYSKLTTNQLTIDAASSSGKELQDHPAGFVIVKGAVETTFIDNASSTVTVSRLGDQQDELSVNQPSWVQWFPSLTSEFTNSTFYLKTFGEDLQENKNYVVANYGYQYKNNNVKFGDGNMYSSQKTIQGQQNLTVLFEPVIFKLSMWLDDPNVEGLEPGDSNRILACEYNIETGFGFNGIDYSGILVDELEVAPTYWGVVTDADYWREFGYEATLAGNTLTLVNSDPSRSIKFELGSGSNSAFGHTYQQTNSIRLISWGNLPTAADVEAKQDVFEKIVPYLFPFYETCDLQVMSSYYLYVDGQEEEHTASYGEQYSISYNHEEPQTFPNLEEGEQDVLFEKKYVVNTTLKVSDKGIEFLSEEDGGTLVELFLKVVNPLKTDEYFCSQDGWLNILKYYDIILNLGGEEFILTYADSNESSYNYNESFVMGQGYPYIISFQAKLKVADLTFNPICGLAESKQDIANVPDDDFRVLFGSAVSAILWQGKNNAYWYYYVSVELPEHFLLIFEDMQTEANALSYNIYIHNYDWCETNSGKEDFTDIIISTKHGFELSDSPLRYSINSVNTSNKLDLGADAIIIEPDANIDDADVKTFNLNISYELSTNQLYMYYIKPEDSAFASTYSYITRDYNLYSVINLKNDKSVSSTDYVLHGWILSSDVHAWLGNYPVSFAGSNGEFAELPSASSYPSNLDAIQQSINDVFASGSVVVTIRYGYSVNTDDNGYYYKEVAFSTAEYCFDLGRKVETITGEANGYDFYFVNTVHDSWASFAGNSSNPYLRALWGKPYSVTISNDIDNTSTIHSQTTDDRTTYFGVYGSWASGYTQPINLTVVNDVGYRYPFFTNDLNNYHTAFYTNENFTIKQASSNGDSAGSNWWFVYNYGYEVDKWVVYFVYRSKTYYLNLNGNNWEYTQSYAALPVSSLNSTSGVDTRLLGFLDSLLEWSGDSSYSPELYMYPIWTPSKIVASSNKFNYSNLSSQSYITFGNSYNFSKYNDNVSAPKGKTMVYFASKDNSIVAHNADNSLIWNYRRLSYNNFTYANGMYNIDLTPIFLDKIHKVELRNVSKLYKDEDENLTRYILSSNDYSFADQSKYFTLTEYSYSQNELYTADDGFKFTNIATFKSSQSGYIWTENYTSILSTFSTNYNNAISGNSTTNAESKYLDILRKIYVSPYVQYQMYNYSKDGNEYPTISVSQGNLSLYVYFANEQNVGLLPAFLTDYYQLIMWKNEGVSDSNSRVNYAYRTDLYNLAPDVFITAVKENNLTDYTSSKSGVWKYSQCQKLGSSENAFYLEPLYFRNFYYLDVQTILEDSTRSSELGYVIVESLDSACGDESIKYLAICLNNEMKYYSFNYSINWGSLLDYTNENGESGKISLINTSKLKQVEKIKIFAGCDVTFNVYDQSQDPEAMASEKYDEMIGYEFLSLTWQYAEDNNYSFDKELNGYQGGVDERTIENTYRLVVGQSYPVKVEFGKLSYTFDTMLDNESAGHLVVSDFVAGQTHNNKQFVRDLNIKVGQRITITYCATIGYEFKEDAFVLLLANAKNSKETLVQYSTLKKDNGTIERKFSFILSGSWLRQYFYCASSKPQDYRQFKLSYTDSEMAIEKDAEYEAANPQQRENYFGIIEVLTQQISFATEVRVYDSSKTGDDAWLEKTQLSNNWHLGNTIVISRVFNSNKDFDNGKGLAYVYNFEGVDYAFVCSYAYCYANLNNKGYLYTAYDFPLYDNLIINKVYNPTESLGYILNVNSDNIVPLNSRTIIMIVEVREILQIEVKVQTAENDTETTNRQVTISNSETNSKQITITPSTPKNGNYYATTATIYTYNGLKYNTIQTQFDKKRYSGVEFTLISDDEKQIGNRFEVNTNSTLIVKFIPSNLGISVNYYLEGQLTSLQELEDILTKFEIMTNGELYQNSVSLYVGNSVSAMFSLHSDYVISIIINGNDMQISNNRVNYTVQDKDYDFGVINIDVRVEEKPSSTITVKYQLADNKASANDNYGEIIVYVGDQQQEGSSNVKVISGRRVSVQLKLNSGYEYTGQIGFYGSKTNKPVSAGYIELISSFTVNENNGVYSYPYAGVYIVYIVKSAVTVDLQIENSIKGNYTIDSNSSYTTKLQNGKSSEIRNAYVGVTITFSIVDEAKDEHFVNFYYLNKLGNEVVVQSNRLTITPEMLDECCSNKNYQIVCGVKVLPKYKVEIEITSDYEDKDLEGLVVNESKLTNESDGGNNFGENLVSGNYYVTGTTAKLIFFATEKDKYDIIITVNGLSVDEVVDKDGKTTYDLTITTPTLIVVKIAPKKFNVQTKEYHYLQLEDLENEDLNAVEKAKELNGLTLSSEEDTLYNFEANISIELEGTDTLGAWQLTRLELTTIDGITITIELENGEITVFANGEELTGTEEFNVNAGEQTYTYKITLQNGKLCINYLTQQDVYISAYYTSLKTIEPSE